MEILSRADARKYREVRLVHDGSNRIVPVEVAFERAEEADLDVVVVSDKSSPPVVRIQDFKKIQYEQKKSRQKRQQSNLQKEIQLKLNISEHDLQTKLATIQRFLDRGNKVKVMVRLKGRERESPERVKDLLQKICDRIECRQSSLPGQATVMILEPPK